jgi:uncharacterized protein (TIGR00369 family)
MYDLKAHQRRISEKLEGQFFMRHIGFSIDEIGRGRVAGSMPLQQFSFQQLGFVHGGVIATVADIVAGFAAYSESPLDKNVVTSSLHVMYFHPGEGVRLRAVGKVIKAGSRLHYCESEVYVQKHDHSELLIARANSTMVMI